MEKIAYGVLNKVNDMLQRMSSLTGKYGLCIAKTKIAIAGEVTVYKELFGNLLKKYGEEKDGKLEIGPGSKNWAEFLKEYEKLLSTETEVEIYRIDKKDFKLDDVYCDTATAEDYVIFSDMMIKNE